MAKWEGEDRSVQWIYPCANPHGIVLQIFCKQINFIECGDIFAICMSSDEEYQFIFFSIFISLYVVQPFVFLPAKGYVSFFDDIKLTRIALPSNALSPVAAMSETTREMNNVLFSVSSAFTALWCLYPSQLHSFSWYSQKNRWVFQIRISLSQYQFPYLPALCATNSSSWFPFGSVPNDYQVDGGWLGAVMCALLFVHFTMTALVQVNITFQLCILKLKKN